MTPHTLLIRLQPLTSRPPYCRGCNRSTPHIHDTSLRRVRERDLLSWKVWLDVPVRRLRCSSCGIMTEKIDWLPERQRYTSSLSAWVESLVRLLPVTRDFVSLSEALVPFLTPAGSGASSEAETENQ